MKGYNKFIEVTSGNGRKTLVNVDQIALIRKSSTGCSIYTCNSEAMVNTKESYEEIKEMLPSIISIADIE